MSLFDIEIEIVDADIDLHKNSNYVLNLNTRKRKIVRVKFFWIDGNGQKKYFLPIWCPTNDQIFGINEKLAEVKKINGDSR